MPVDHTPAPPVLYSFPTTNELREVLADFILKAQREAVEKKERLSVAISGGSLPANLAGLIGRDDVEWDRWHIFYVDERVVPVDHSESNHRLCKEEFLSKVPIPEENIHTIDYSYLDTSPVDLEELAEEYQDRLIKHFVGKDAARFPVFDLILLGMGPDGHTASLFPNSELFNVDESTWVGFITQSPKPPSERITLTLPVINHAARIAFVAAGEAKQNALAITLDKPDMRLPGSRVRPALPGVVYWFVDDAAAAKLQYPRSDYSNPGNAKPELKL